MPIKYDAQTGEKLEKQLSGGWIVVALFFPTIAIIAGLYYMVKERQGATGVLLAGIIFQFLWVIIYYLLLVFMAYPYGSV